jgi:hypothetical protein
MCKEIATTEPTSAQIEFNMPQSPYTLTRFDWILFAVSLIFAIDRHSTENFLPFQLGLVFGVVPPECLIWTFLLVEMGARDTLRIYQQIFS